jgi:hypothetical protein
MKEELLNSINALIPEDYKKVIESFNLNTFNKKNFLIINLKRDQHLRFKKLFEDISSIPVDSIYIKIKEIFYKVYGETSYEIKEGIFKSDPNFLIQNENNKNFYFKINDLAPKGRTRACIVVDPHIGIIPYVLKEQFNKIYAIELDKKLYPLTKENLKTNKVNNTLLLKEDLTKFLEDYKNHKYVDPGKKEKIGFMILNYSIIDSKILSLIIDTKPETLVLYSKQIISEEKEKVFKNLNFEAKYSVTVGDYYLLKLKGV